MSSSEAYSSSEEERPAAKAPARESGQRGAKPRGARDRENSARRNPKRYTTAEMDAEIAMYKESGSSSSSSDDDSEEEETLAAAKAKRGTPKAAARRTPPKRRAGYKKRPPPKKPAAKKKKKDDFIDDSDESEEEWDEEDASDAGASGSEEGGSDSDSDFGAPKKKRGGRTAAKRATPARSTRKRTARTAYRESSEEEEEERIDYYTTPTGARRPSRHCKTESEAKIKGMVKKDMQSEKEALGDMLEDDDKEMLENSGEEGESSSSDEEVAPRGSGKRLALNSAKKKKASKYDDDDESYDENAPGENEESDDDDEMSDYEEESDEPVTKKSSRRSTRRSSPRKKGRPKYKDVDESEDEISTADEDSEDEATGPSLLMSPARKASGAAGSYGSPTARQRARARQGRSPLDLKEDDGSEEEFRDEDRPSAKKPRPSPTERRTTHIDCPSTIDHITMATLPTNKPHVCYVAPDGRTRHCFALDTLYRIAISAKSGEDPSITTNQKLQFLQPPHFRSPMEDDLLDQIACRFGRPALVIENSALYKRMKGHSLAGLDDELDEFDEDGEYVGGDGAGSANFRDRFERYLQNLMGSQDLYCCPLCYNEADRRLGNHDEEMWEDDGSDEEDAPRESEDHFSFLDDPLTILGSLDADHLEVAASFCFRLLKDVKTHLKAVHNVNISDVAGNDLYKRFQIRTGDGLLQSWLKKNLGRHAKQGDMTRYWNNGENQSFILLLSQIQRGEATGEHSGEFGSDFSRSFPNRARRIWRDVSAPYLKEQDMGDFLVGEGEEESEEEGDAVRMNPHFSPEEFQSPVEQMIARLKKKNRQRGVFDNSDASLQEDDDSSDLEVLPKKRQYEEEEEEDEWTKSKSYKAKSKGKQKPGSDDSDSDDDSVFDSDAEKPKPKRQSNGGSARKVIGEGNSFDSEDEEDRKPAAKVNSARKRVLEDSDEE
ncbi:hypothetical protein ACHAXT_013252 [Thalassiosira profunda]